MRGLTTVSLLQFSRLTLGLQRDQRLVRALAWYVAAGWLASEITFFTACRPFSAYWALPPPNPQCTTLEHYAIVQGCFNISADVLMLGIPIPLIVRMRLPWRQKIVLIIVFSLGIFVILAALMTKIFNLTDVYNPNYMLWYVREASVAVYVSNLPMIWPLLREWFPCLRKLTPGVASPPRSSNNNNNNNNTRGSRWMIRRGTVRLVDEERGQSSNSSSSGSCNKKYTSRKSSATPNVSSLSTSRSGGERSERGGLLPPIDHISRGLKEPFVTYEDIELAITEIEDDNPHYLRDSSEKSRGFSFSSSNSGCSGGGDDDDDDDSDVDVDSWPASRVGLQHQSKETRVDEGRAVYLDAPAKAVTKIEAGSTVRVQSAECQFVLVDGPTGREEDHHYHHQHHYTTATIAAKHKSFSTTRLQKPPPQQQLQQQQQRGGIQVQTTFGVRQEQVWSPNRARSPRCEETGIAW